MEIMERIKDWLIQAQAQLDEWGRPAWIALMVFSFVFFGPLGLVVLFYMIWSGRMGCSKSERKHRFGRKGFAPTGNSAFDAYREETLKRLEEEQGAFESFMERLRKAKDQAEFDQFMDERRRPSGATVEGQAV